MATQIERLQYEPVATSFRRLESIEREPGRLCRGETGEGERRQCEQRGKTREGSHGSFGTLTLLLPVPFDYPRMVTLRLARLRRASLMALSGVTAVVLVASCSGDSAQEDVFDEPHDGSRDAGPEDVRGERTHPSDIEASSSADAADERRGGGVTDASSEGARSDSGADVGARDASVELDVQETGAEAASAWEASDAAIADIDAANPDVAAEDSAGIDDAESEVRDATEGDPDTSADVGNAADVVWLEESVDPLRISTLPFSSTAPSRPTFRMPRAPKTR